MMPILMILAFVLFLALAILLGVYGYLQEKKRQEALTRLAAELGFRFDPKDPFAIARNYERFRWIDQGHKRRAYNVLHGRIDDYEVKAFDYVYHTTQTTRDSKGRTTTREVSHYFSAVIFDGSTPFETLVIRPQHFGDRIFAAFGFSDIEFESAEFNRDFHVTSASKKFAYDVVHPRMMEFLMAHPHWSLQLLGTGLMIQNGSRLTPEQFREAIDFVRGFFGLFPEYLWQHLRDTRDEKAE
jgi:hypothetical protein